MEIKLEGRNLSHFPFCSDRTQKHINGGKVTFSHAISPQLISVFIVLAISFIALMFPKRGNSVCWIMAV